MLASGKGDKNIKTNPTSCGFKEKRGGTPYASPNGGLGLPEKQLKMI
jgi:hypothetical protein